MHNFYSAFGLILESEIPLSEITVSNCTPDVFIRYGKVPQYLENNIRNGLKYQINDREFLLKVDGVASYYIREGKQVIVQPHQGACAHDVKLFLMGSAIGALLHQRNLLPLHGSSIKFGDEAVIFTGDSGAGKSTIAAAFYNLGYPLLADDLCVVTTETSSTPMVYPGFKQMKLWGDSLKKIGIKSEKLQRVRLNTEIDKFFVPVTDICMSPIPIKTIFVLDSHKKPHFELIELKGMEKIAPLQDMTFRLKFLEGAESKINHFSQCARLAANARIISLTRPDKGFLLEELIERVQKCL